MEREQAGLHQRVRDAALLFGPRANVGHCESAIRGIEQRGLTGPERKIVKAIVGIAAAHQLGAAVIVPVVVDQLERHALGHTAQDERRR